MFKKFFKIIRVILMAISLSLFLGIRQEKNRLMKNGSYLYISEAEKFLICDYLMRGASFQFAIFLLKLQMLREIIRLLAEWKRVRRWEKRHQK